MRDYSFWILVAILCVIDVVLIYRTFIKTIMYCFLLNGFTKKMFIYSYLAKEKDFSPFIDKKTINKKLKNCDPKEFKISFVPQIKFLPFIDTFITDIKIKNVLFNKKSNGKILISEKISLNKIKDLRLFKGPLYIKKYYEDKALFIYAFKKFKGNQRSIKKFLGKPIDFNEFEKRVMKAVKDENFQDYLFIKDRKFNEVCESKNLRIKNNYILKLDN